MGRTLRLVTFACSLLLVAVVFQSPTVRAVDPDSDGDGLTDGYEDANLYVQRSAASGLPKGIIDNGAGATSVTILLWQGVVAGGFAEFEVDHPAKSELTVQIGYWDGSAWVDRHVWDPGSRLLGVTIIQPAPNAVLQGIITAKATVPAGDIVDKVEFFIGTTSVATVTAPTATNTFSASIDTVPFPIGNYQLKAVMTDKVGATREATIPVRIDDTAAPTVSFALPASGAHVRGTATVKVYAADASGIASVDLKVDGGSFFSITNSFSGGYYWYNWATGSLSNGAHSLTAQATDRRARVSTATVSVTVDNVAPSVSITSPASDSDLSGSVTVTATASDNAGVYGVAFYVDNGWRATDLTSPYQFVWLTAAEQDAYHWVKATATDHAGNSASHQVRVLTTNGNGGGGGCTPPPPCPTGPEPTGTMGVADPSILSFTTSTTMMISGITQTGTVSTLVVDLVKSRTQVTQVERDNRILPAEFDRTLLHSQLSWRIVLRDWVYSGGGGGGGGGGGCDPACPTGTMSAVETVVLTSETTSTSTQGTLRSYAMRLEERSDKTKTQTDDDGLNDGAEVLTHTTYPVTPDTDADGARDPVEVSPQTITYPVNGASRTATVKTSQTAPDTDTDGLLDGEEYTAGVDRVVTHPVNIDTDGDLLNDGPEVTTHLSNATRTDTDGDTISDYTEVNARTLVLTVNGGSQTRTVKTLAYAEDSDGDGLRDDKEFPGTSAYGVKTDPSDADTDDDNLPDGQEKYVREFAMPIRKTVGTSLWVDLTSSISGAIERVDVRYGLSNITVSNFFVELKKGTTYLTLRNRVGSGLYNFSSKDITSSFTHGGTATYSLHVTSSVGGGVLEEFALSFTLRTSPIHAHTDGDGLNDSEEVTYGIDGWITDPNRVDTDLDAWSDSDEIQAKGTSPLAWDTDQDGIGDSSDLDPLRNLLVAVKVKKIFHGNHPWCTPKMAGIVWVNSDYTWVTEHRIATEHQSFTPCGEIRATSVFDLTYYADVPDGTSSVSVRGAGWSIVDGRWDDLLVDATVGYTLLSVTASHTIQNGNSWMTFDVWTHALEKTKTFLVTDRNTTVTASNGQHRLTGQDRYFVFTFDVTSASAPFVYGVNTIVVPRSLFLESKLKADFASGSYWPLDGTDAKLYGENLGKPDVSEAVAGVIAKSLSGSNAKSVLDRLVRNTTNVLVYSYVDVTSYALLANLPADVVRILPWAGVVNGATGAAPEGFSDWFLNSLTEVGQLFYRGLVALVSFLADLAQAIADWGMRLFGAVSQAVAGAVQAVAEAFSTLVDFLIDFIMALFRSVVQPIIQPVLDLASQWAGSVRIAADAAFMPHSPPLYMTDFEKAYQWFSSVLTSGAFFVVLAAFAVGTSVAQGILSAYSAASAGALGALAPYASQYVARFFIESALTLFATTAIAAAGAAAMFYWLIPEGDPFWREGIGLAALGVAGFATNFIIRWSLPATLKAAGIGDAAGLFLAIAGLALAIGWQDPLGAWVSLALEVLGFGIILGEDVLDRIPINPLKNVEEVISLIAIGHGAATLKQIYAI